MRLTIVLFMAYLLVPNLAWADCAPGVVFCNEPFRSQGNSQAVDNALKEKLLERLMRQERMEQRQQYEIQVPSSYGSRYGSRNNNQQLIDNLIQNQDNQDIRREIDNMKARERFFGN